jgi:hypothetical protein
MSGDQSFDAGLVREGDLGLNIDELEGFGKLRVRRVQQDGCVAKFNHAMPESAIRVGDCLTRINDAEATLKERAAEGHKFRLTVSRDPQQATPQAQCSESHDHTSTAMPPVVKMDNFGFDSCSGIFASEHTSCIAKFNHAMPESAIRMGDCVTRINDAEAALKDFEHAAEGHKFRLTISREPQQATPQAQCSENRDHLSAAMLPVVKMDNFSLDVDVVAPSYGEAKRFFLGCISSAMIVFISVFVVVANI